MQRILMITGWGGGTQLLHPLKHQLESYTCHVEVWNIFNGLDAEILKQKAELAKDFDVIIGWSLGGQLATLLVDQIYQQYGSLKILITLGSNPCFVANAHWAVAMEPSTFQNFKQSFQQDAISTLKKFGYMVCQGTTTTKQDFVTLQSLIQAQNLEILRQGLACLEELNNVTILKHYAGHQYHLFAKQDYLVSYKVEQNIANIATKFFQTELISGSHGFPVFQPALVSDKIVHYLKNI